MAAACRLLGVGRPASVGVAAAAGVASAATVADCGDLTTCSWFRTTGIVLVLLSLVAGADLFLALTVRLVAFGLTLFEDWTPCRSDSGTGRPLSLSHWTFRSSAALSLLYVSIFSYPLHSARRWWEWRDSCRAVRNPHVHR